MELRVKWWKFAQVELCVSDIMYSYLTAKTIGLASLIMGKNHAHVVMLNINIMLRGWGFNPIQDGAFWGCLQIGGHLSHISCNDETSHS